MRTGLILVLATAALLAGALFYPVGGQIWSAEQVTGLAIGAGAQRRVLQDPRRLEMAVRDALASAQADRLRRWLPGQHCMESDLSFLTAKGWVDVHLYCSSGFLFDTIRPDAWR